jgi:hypothetical protein
MDIKKLINEQKKGKVFIFIQSRLHENDVAGQITELEGFDTLELPLLYSGKPCNTCNNSFKQWRKVDK